MHNPRNKKTTNKKALIFRNAVLELATKTKNSSFKKMKELFFYHFKKNSHINDKYIIKEKNMRNIILCGKTCSGKTTVIKKLEEAGLKRIVTYTTRPKRPNEIDGIDYHFLSKDEFLRKEASGEFIEIAKYNASFGECYYGSCAKDYTDNSVIILNPIGIKSIKGKIDSIIIYLDIKENDIKERAIKRGDNLLEIERRIIADKKDFKDIATLVDYTIHINNETPQQLADIILRYIEKQK